MSAESPPGNDEATEREEMARRAWRLSGRVQGVGFRWWTARTARSLGLRGTVENLADGTVEVHAEGPVRAVERLERRLHGGPRAARVDGMQPIRPAPELPDDFQITG